MSSRWIMAATAACSSLLLSGCILGLPDAAPYPDSGSVPAAERQTLEAFVSDAMPRYMSIIEEVAMESGGVIADVGHSETRPCRSEVNGYEIRAVCFNLPLIEYEDMRRIVGEAAQPTATCIRLIRFLGMNDTCAAGQVLWSGVIVLCPSGWVMR